MADPVFYAEDREGVLRRWIPPANLRKIAPLIEAVERMEEADEANEGEIPLHIIQQVYAARRAAQSK